MPVTLKKTVAVFDGVCAVEEAETLLAWLQENPKGRVNLKRCTHIHTAVLQVLLAFRPRVSPFPEDQDLAAWLAPAFGTDS